MAGMPIFLGGHNKNWHVWVEMIEHWKGTIYELVVSVFGDLASIVSLWTRAFHHPLLLCTAMKH